MIGRLLTLSALAITFVIICAAVGLALLKFKADRLQGYWQDRSAQQGELIYVALGDSAAQGVGASDPDKSYVGHIAEMINTSTGRKVRVINLSRNGATAHDVLTQQIPQLERLSSARPAPVLVTLDVGANDVTHDTQGKATFRQDYEKILQAMPPGQSVVADVPYFGGRIRADGKVRQANAVIKDLAGKYRIPVAPLYDQLKPRQSPWIYAADLFHPNDRGYAIWYDAFRSKAGPIIDAQRSPQLPITDQPIPLPPPGQ